MDQDDATLKPSKIQATFKERTKERFLTSAILCLHSNSHGFVGDVIAVSFVAEDMTTTTGAAHSAIYAGDASVRIRKCTAIVPSSVLASFERGSWGDLVLSRHTSSPMILHSQPGAISTSARNKSTVTASRGGPSLAVLFAPSPKDPRGCGIFLQANLREKELPLSRMETCQVKRRSVKR